MNFKKTLSLQTCPSKTDVSQLSLRVYETTTNFKPKVVQPSPFCVTTVPVLIDGIPSRIPINVLHEGKQLPGTFKVRGAECAIQVGLRSGAINRAVGVITASAGNHASGLSSVCKREKIPCTIYMPTGTDPKKIQNCMDNDATVILHGTTFDDANKQAQQVATDQLIPFIPPYNDPDVIAGQGSVFNVILANLHANGSLPKKIVVVVPIGGGGLIAGIANTAMHTIDRHFPDLTIEIVGVELPPEGSSDSRLKHLLDGAPVYSHVSANPFAAGAAVKQLGAIPADIITFVQASHTVTLTPLMITMPQIVRAMRILNEQGYHFGEEAGNPPAEPTGAMSIAGLIEYYRTHSVDTNTQVIPVITGSNINEAALNTILNPH